MATTHQDAGSFPSDLTLRRDRHLVFSEDVAYDPVRQPRTWLRATALCSIEGKLISAESASTDEKIWAFEDLPDLEKLLGRTNLSDLEDLPDLEDLLDLEKSDSAGTFLPAMESGRRSPYRFRPNRGKSLKR